MSEFLKHFSKPYLVFFFWWLVINLDFVLILIGKEHILSSLIARYGYTIRTAIGSIIGSMVHINTSPLLYICSILLYHMIIPLLLTAVTVLGMSWLMNWLNTGSDIIVKKAKDCKELKFKKSNEEKTKKIADLEEEIQKKAESLGKQIKSLEDFPKLMSDIVQHLDDFNTWVLETIAKMEEHAEDEDKLEIVNQTHAQLENYKKLFPKFKDLMSKELSVVEELTERKK